MPKSQASISPQEMHGRELAVQLIRALGADWKAVKVPSTVKDWAVSEFMVSREPSTMRGYFDKVQSDPAAMRGFLCVLSDYIGGEVNAQPGFALDAHFLGKHD